MSACGKLQHHDADFSPQQVPTEEYNAYAEWLKDGERHPPDNRVEQSHVGLLASGLDYHYEASQPAAKRAPSLALVICRRPRCARDFEAALAKWSGAVICPALRC